MTSFMRHLALVIVILTNCKLANSQINFLPYDTTHESLHLVTGSNVPDDLIAFSLKPESDFYLLGEKHIWCENSVFYAAFVQALQQLPIEKLNIFVEFPISMQKSIDDYFRNNDYEKLENQMNYLFNDNIPEEYVNRYANLIALLKELSIHKPLKIFAIDPDMGLINGLRGFLALLADNKDHIVIARKERLEQYLDKINANRTGSHWKLPVLFCETLSDTTVLFEHLKSIQPYYSVLLANYFEFLQSHGYASFEATKFASTKKSRDEFMADHILQISDSLKIKSVFIGGAGHACVNAVSATPYPSLGSLIHKALPTKSIYNIYFGIRQLAPDEDPKDKLFLKPDFAFWKKHASISSFEFDLYELRGKSSSDSIPSFRYVLLKKTGHDCLDNGLYIQSMKDPSMKIPRKVLK